MGIPFGGAAPMTDVFFLICSKEDRGHLRVLARLSRLLSQLGFLHALRSAPDAAATRQLIVEGERNKDIADCLCISIKTVEKHRSNLMKKLDLHNVAELTAFAMEKGLLAG